MAVDDARLAALARRAAHGERAAFASLCAALEPEVWRYCRALLAGDDEAAADAAQDTLVRAATAIRDFRGDAPVRRWLLAIARRAVADELRRRQRRRRLQERLEVRLAPTGPAPSAEAASTVEADELLAALPLPLRQALVLTQLLGCSYEDAAAILGCRLGTVRSRVHRARERLIAEHRAHHEESETGTAATRSSG